jgi:hypothetical protein
LLRAMTDDDPARRPGAALLATLPAAVARLAELVSVLKGDM